MICADKYSPYKNVSSYIVSQPSPKTNEVIRAKGATRNTCLGRLFFFHSLAAGPVIREANHILIYSVLIDFFQISVSNIAFHHSVD